MSSAHIPPHPDRHHRRLRAAAALIAFLLVVASTGIAWIGFAHDESTVERAGGAMQTTGSSPENPVPSSSANPTEQVIHRIDTDKPVIFVTIDDGRYPSREALDIVREHDIPVSLFLNEDPVVDNRSYFAEYIALGNYVHSHTLNHPELTQLDTPAQEQEICGMVDILNEHYGGTQQVGSLLRAPYGAADESTAAAAQRCGLDTIVHWTAIAENGQLTLATGTELQPGDIILTHFTEDLPENLTRIRQLTNDAGLTIARLEDYL